MTTTERAKEWLKEGNGYAKFAEYETADIIQQLLTAHSVMLEALELIGRQNVSDKSIAGMMVKTAREVVEKVRGK